MRLPTIDIESFEGDPLKFPSFINAFEGMIDRNTRLADVQKFYYLRGLLKGRAKSTIEGFVFTDGNYREALGLLKERFGDQKLLQASFIGSLMDLKEVTDSKNTRALRHLHDSIETYIPNLKSLHITAETYGTMLVPCILKKIPPDIRLQVTLALENENSWDFERVLKIFNQHLMAREACAFVGKSDDKQKPPPQTQSHESTGSLLTSAEEAATKISCFFCQQDHKGWNCTVVTDIPTRKKIIMEQDRCFVCFRKDHETKDCPSEFHCFRCKGRHNSCLCEKEKKPASTQLTTIDDSVEIAVPTVTDSSLSATTGKSLAGEPVLLKTAIVSLTDVEQNVGCKGRVLFDDASSRTYITKTLSQNLRLQPLTKKRGIINGACATSTFAECDVVQLKVNTTDPNVQIVVTASVIDEICKPIEGQGTFISTSEYPYLSGVEISDFQSDNTPKSIDILIGGDYYYQFVMRSHPQDLRGSRKLPFIFAKDNIFAASTMCS